jgi:group I intron endonuclease
MSSKKELKQKYKETLPPMGIYQIRNIVNGKILIGSSKNLHGKSNSYKFQLQHGSHMNSALQNDFNKFGTDNFLFEIVDNLEPKEGVGYDYTDDLITLEELWIEKLQPFGERGYNKMKKKL